MINNSLFKVGKIPDYHPIVDKYELLEYWQEQKKRCIEGYWVGGKWITGELYYYVNFHTIMFEEGTYRGLGLPWMRDNEFENTYIYAEACGFSGFELDDELSCHRGLSVEEHMDDEDIIKLCTIGGINKTNKFYLNNFYKPDGTRKTYVPARDYLHRIHKGNLGKPIYLNQAKHIMEVGSRGEGKSYKSSGYVAHNFLFDGARDYDLYLSKKQDGNPLQTETVVGAIDAKFSNKLIAKVKIGIEKLPGSKIITMDGEQVLFPSPLAVNTTGSYAVGRELISTNSKSTLQHVTFADNPFAASGGRPNKVFIDEVGFMNNIKEAWEAVENTQAVADFKRLTMYGLGTGGLTSGGAVTYVQDIFYNPEAYGCLTFEDEWENRGKIGRFLSGVIAMNKFKEGPNLVTNKEKAMKFIQDEREKAKKSGSSTKIQGTIINKPIVPSEIFLRMSGTFFPTHELQAALGDLESNTITLKANYIADLIEKTKGNITILPSEKHIINDYPIQRGTDMDAAIEIFKRPKLGDDGRPTTGRYIIANDPVDDDGNDNTARSLQSTWVLDTWTDELVAEYTARTYLVDEYYENVRKLCVLYNAKLLYENNKKGLYGYFKNKSALMFLAETPQILKDQDLIKGGGVGNRSLGVNMSSDKLKLFGINLILKWLEEPSYRDPDKKRLYTIKSRALLKELISFSMDINADRVSALIILMIYRAELDLQIETLRSNKIKTTEQSSFWGRAYGKFKSDKVHKRFENFTDNYEIN